ncbi:MAG: pyridoxal phosphate-dependent aminotransferase [Lachnospiraceae bacterium]|nr:pyridoxal phosphate-dependent aminotransferase [Lachnospiraceae bacterium]
MGRYDFDTVIGRRSTFASKWDIGENEIAMSMADMEFAAAPEIRQALQKRLDNGIYGYTDVPGVWYEAYQGWWARRHGLQIEKEELIFATGVIPAISTAVRKLTYPAEKVLVLTPIYNIFFNSIVNNGRFPIECRMPVKDGEYNIDWEDLEAKAADPQTSLMLFCNPHNPIGRLWDKETLARIGEICARYHVIVLSDEIHCDVVDPGKKYTPFASASETCARISVTCFAPTKAFNLAGLHTAAVMVKDPFLRHKMWRGLNTDEVAEPGAFAVEGTVAAFTEGEAWLEEMCSYVKENKDRVRQVVAEKIPQVRITPSEGTYLLWMDCSAVTDSEEELGDFIREKTGLVLTKGTLYGKGGEKYLRMNCACPRALLEDGLERFVRGVKLYMG